MCNSITPDVPTVLTASFYGLSLAVAAGVILSLLHLRATDAGMRPPLWSGLAHGIVGAVGLLLLLPVAFGPPRGAAAGAASFGPIAGWLFLAAAGTGMMVLMRRRKGPNVVMAIHAGMAITGYVMFVAWYAVG